MTVAADKNATTEFVTEGVAIKERVGAEACSADTVTTCTNVLAVCRFNGMNSSSTGTERNIMILVGETAPTGEYDNAGVGSLFIKVGTAGALYMMTSAGTWQVATFS